MVKKLTGIILTAPFLGHSDGGFCPRISRQIRSSRPRHAFNSPGKIQLWFNERLEPKYSYASVHDPDGKRVDVDNAQVAAEDPKQLSIGVKKLPAGRYTVKFRVLSVDGHVVEQSFPFTIREAKN